MNMAKLCFSKIGHGPPSSLIDQRENLLARVRVGSFGNGEIGDAALKWSDELAVVEVVLRQVDCGTASAALCRQWLQCCYGMRCLLHLLVALLELRFGLLVLSQCGIELRLREHQLRTSLLQRLLAGCLQRLRLIDLVYRDELLSQQRLNAMQIVGCIRRLCVRTVDHCFCADYRCFGFIDSGCGPGQVCLSTFRVCFCYVNGAPQRGNGAALVDDLAFERGTV